MPSVVQAQVGVAGTLSKSFMYDEAQYQQTDPINTSIAAAASSNTFFTAYTTKQFKSLTVLPTTAPTANDQLTITLTTLGGVGGTFGTVTTVNYTAGLTGTVTATASNILSFTGYYPAGGTGTSTRLGAGQTVPLGEPAAMTPTYWSFSGGTFDVVVANASGTATQTAYVFPTGPNGGLTLSPGDLVKIAKGTDTVGVYYIEAELTFTPGSSVTK